MPEVEVSGFVERVDEVASEVAAALGIRRVDSVSELARLSDAIVIATQTVAHAEVARECIELGCDVMIEKPITATLQEADDLIALAEKHERVIQVGHVERYNPAVRQIEEMAASSRFIETERLGVFSSRSLDIDVILDLMIHDFHLVLSLTGSEVTEIRAVGIPVLTSKVDIANVRLEMANGAVANLTASRVSSERVRKLRLFSTDSYLSVDLKDQTLKGYRLDKSGAVPSVVPLELNVQKKEPLRAELEGFVEAVRNRATPPLVDATGGRAALDLAIQAGEIIEKNLAKGSR
jgi:predicted dehydrogenase